VVGWALTPHYYAVYCSWLLHKAKSCFWFTRCLPGISLNRSVRRPYGRPDGVLSNMSKILLAEDDTDMRRFLVKALQNAGFEVTSYDNGLSAYHRLREEPFELLLTDIVMPEMDGIELARRAAELDPDIKIMFITGFAAVALNADSNAPKHAKVLSKPIHLRELVTEVQKMLAA
jgi:two-component system cell cycle response regulator CpdR